MASGRSVRKGTLTERSLILILCSILFFPLAAQEFRGRLQGIVTDPTQAVVAGASVTLTNEDTGTTATRQTNEAGQYLFDLVNPGNYSLTVRLEGFRTFVQKNILVQTLSDITVNAAMEVGAVTETVTVSESPVSVQFNSTSMNTTLDRRMSTSLPLVSRNPWRLLVLDPQVTPTGNLNQTAPYHSFTANDMDTGGGTERNNEITVDGVPNTWGMKNNYTPPMDAVSELNIAQNSVDAEYGHSAGGTVSVQMKGGTNEWHGSAYYYGRNPRLNAIADSISSSPSSTRHHTWGVTSGNPVLRNRLFNYFSYEGQRLADPKAGNWTLPTPLERRGDFSQSRNAAGGLRTIYDPWTTVFDAKQNRASRQPFAGNIIPATRIDPASQNVLKHIWEPNRAGDDITGVNNFRLTFPDTYRYWNFSNRTDWNINDQWRIFGRYSRFNTLETAPDITGIHSPAQGSGGSERNGWQVAGDAVWTISPSTVFNIRGGFNQPVDNYEDPQSSVTPEDIYALWNGNRWYQPYAGEIPKQFYPGINVGGSQFGRAGYWYGQPKHWSLSSKASMQRGRHYLKAGAEYRGIHMSQGAFRPIDFRFTPNLTAETFISPNTKLNGDAWATMLLGALDNNTAVQTRPLNEGQNYFVALFFNDDFKINSRITLNLGLRWEYDSPIGDARDRLSRYLDLTDPIPEFQGAGAPVMPAEVTALRTAPPVYNGAWLFTTPENPHAYHAPLTAFMPRVGLAYRVNNKTALRLGYARYGVPSSINFAGGVNILNAVPYPAYDVVSYPLPVLEGIPQARFSNPFPAGVNPLVEPVAKTLGRYTNLGSTQNAVWFYQDLKNANNDRINFSVQRELPGRFLVDATYFVSIGSNHYYERSVNLYDPQIRYKHGAAVARKVNNPFYNILTPQKFPGAIRNQKTVAVSDLLTPYPQYRNLTEQSTPGLRRRYQAIQIKVQRPFVNGFNFLGGYAYNRNREDEFFDDIATFNRQLELTDQPDARHKLNAAGIYDLPFGRGRRHMSNAHPAVQALFGGWTVSGIYQYQGGAFLRFGAMLVNGDPALPDGEKTRNRMFRTEVFSQQPAYTPRSNPKQFAGVHGPRYTNLDATIMKEVPFRERFAFELRMECYNVTNSFMGGTVNVTVTSSQFGRITAQRQGHYGRQFQYTARVRW